MKNLNKKQKILFVSGLCTLFLFIIGATYAYFSVTVNNNSSNASLGGTTNDYGIVTLTTNTSKLYLRFTSDEMAEDKVGTVYYANSSSTGTPLTTDPNYTLATATLTGGVFPVEAEYSFKVLASSTKTITDTIAESIKVKIGETTLTLKELLAAGTTGLNVTGIVQDISEGNPKTIPITVSVENLNSSQDDLSNNTFKIIVNPTEKTGKRLLKVKRYVKPATFANKLIDSGKLWQSGLEGDGYRYVGSGAVGTSTNPDNFICFGTTNKSDCTANQNKYMYRIIGVFADANGNNHVKLIKYKQLGAYAWNSDYQTNILWENSDMYKGLNESYFLTNTTYDYLQDASWTNRIENWIWSVVNTQTYSDNGPNYKKISTKEMYLHEMNRSTKTSTVGEWTNPVAKIGLMYASDYALSLGSSALTLTGTSSYSTLKTGWMHQSNNVTANDIWEWTLTRCGGYDGDFLAWIVDDDGSVNDDIVHYANEVRPVFYLTIDVTSSGGTGSIDDPYILEN